MPTTSRIGSRSKNKDPTPGTSGRSSTLSGGSPTRTQSLVARIFSNPLRKSNNNRSSGSTPRDGSPAGQSQSPARSPKERRSPSAGQSQSPVRPPSGSTGRFAAGHSHSPSPNRSPVRSPSHRPGRKPPAGLPPQDPLPLYPPGGRAGRRRPSGTGTQEDSGSVQAASVEVTFDSRGVPRGGASTPLTPDASGGSALGGSAMNEDTISVPLKPSRTPKNSDTPPPLDLFPSANVSSAGAVADTSDIVNRRTGPFGPGKGYHGHPTHTTNDVRTVSTAADPASVADTFNEEVDERSIIPVADSVTLQQLSGALDLPIPGPLTLSPHHRSNRYVPPHPGPQPFLPPPDCSAPKARASALIAMSALTASDTIPTSPTRMDHSRAMKQRDFGDDESSNDLSWGLQKLSDRARGGGSGTTGDSPSATSLTPRPPSPGANTNTSSLRMNGGSSGTSNRGQSPDRDSVTDHYTPPHPAAAAAAAAAVAAAAAAVDDSVDLPPADEEYYPQEPVGLPGSPPASAPPAPQLPDEKVDALMHDVGSPSDSEYTSTLLPPLVAAIATHVGSNRLEVEPGTARATQRDTSFGEPDRNPVQGQSSTSSAAFGGAAAASASSSGYSGAGVGGSGLSGPVRRAEPAGPSMTPLKRGLVPAEDEETLTADQQTRLQDEIMAADDEDLEEGPLQAVPYASSSRRSAPRPTPPAQDTSYRQIPSGPSGRFSIHEMGEGGLADMHATSSPPTAPHTTAAQRAALGQLVPNSISSEMSERRAQAFSDIRDSMHPDGDDAMVHALEPMTAPSGSRNPSIDLVSAADPAASVPVATADNGTPVETASATVHEAAVRPPDTISPDNPYVVIQKSGAPSQPSSARLFYQPPTSLNANAPGSINSNAGAQVGAAAGGAMMAAQATSPTPVSPEPVPQNVAVSSRAPEVEATRTAATSATSACSDRPSSRPYRSKSRATPSTHTSRTPSNPAASDPPSAVPEATGANTPRPTPTPAHAAAAATAVPSHARTVPRTRSAQLSSSPPAPGTPPTTHHKPRISYSSSLYSQSFSPMSRSHSQHQPGAASMRSTAGPAPAAAPSVAFTYRKAYSYYPNMSRGAGGAYGAYIHGQGPADAQYRGYGSSRPQSMGPGALPPPSSQQSVSSGGRSASLYGAYGQVVPPPVSGSSVRSMYSSYGAAPPVSTPNARAAPSNPYAARYATGAAPPSSAYTTRAYASAYASTAAVAGSQLSSTASTIPPDEYRPAFGAAARMRGLERNYEQPGSRDSSPVRSDVLTMRERMHSSGAPSVAAPSSVQLESHQRINAHSGALPRSAQPAAAHPQPQPQSHASSTNSANSAVPATLPSQQSMRSPRAQRASKPVATAEEPEPVVAAAAPPSPVEASTKVASAAAASPEASGRLESPGRLEASGRPEASGKLKAAMHPEAAAAVKAAFDVPVLPAEPLALRTSILPSVAATESPPDTTELRVLTKGAVPAPSAPTPAVGPKRSVSASIRRSGSSLRVPAAALVNADAAAEAADAAAAVNVAATAATSSSEAAQPASKAALDEQRASSTQPEGERSYQGPLPLAGIQLLQPQARMRSPFAVEPPKEGSDLSQVLMSVHGTWLMGASDRSAPLLLTQRSSLTTAAGSGIVP